MIQRIEDLFYSQDLVNFVHTHPWAAWGSLTVLISGCLLVPILLTWPKAQKK